MSILKYLTLVQNPQFNTGLLQYMSSYSNQLLMISLLLTLKNWNVSNHAKLLHFTHISCDV